MSAEERDSELRVLRTALLAADRRVAEAKREARRNLLEHATYDPKTRTYTISELTLDRWDLR